MCLSHLVKRWDYRIGKCAYYQIKEQTWSLTFNSALIVIRYLERGDVTPEVAVMAVKPALDLQVVLVKPLTLNLSN